MKWRERCSCGAEIDVDTSGLAEYITREIIRPWREQHRHEPPGASPVVPDTFFSRDRA